MLKAHFHIDPGGNAGFALAVGASTGIALVVIALVVWQRSLDWAQHLNSAAPERLLWSVRCTAAALAFAAQMIMLTFAVGAIYRRDLIINACRLLMVVLFFFCLTGAVALGFAGR